MCIGIASFHAVASPLASSSPSEALFEEAVIGMETVQIATPARAIFLCAAASGYVGWAAEARRFSSDSKK